MSATDNDSGAVFAAVVQRLLHLSHFKIWLLSITASVAMSELIVCGMELLLKGQVTFDYLLTGLVASFFVAGIVAAMLITLLAQLKREIQSNAWMTSDLADSEERCRLAIKASNSAMWDYDLPSGHVFLSENWSKFLGGPERPTYTTIDELTELVPQEEQQTVRDAIVDVVKGNADSYRITHSVRKPDGKYIWISSVGRVTARDKEGRALHMIGINRDITGPS